MENDKRKTIHSGLTSATDNVVENEAGLHGPSNTKHEGQADLNNADSVPLTSPPLGDNFSSRLSAFDMRSVANSLPDQNYRSYSHTQPQIHYNPASPYGQGYMFNYHGSPFPGQAPNTYNMSFPQQVPQTSGQSRGQLGMHMGGQGAAGQLPHMSNPVYFPQQSLPQAHTMIQGNFYGQVASQSPGTYSTNSPQFSRTGTGYSMPQLRVDNFHTGTGANHASYGPFEGLGARLLHSPSSAQSPSALRGPPRKPKQSGHALWVGNLPPGTRITDLKDHFSRDATDDIESVFLISKSNCAFVNYKTEQSCAAAMTRFHDSRFQGVRLVCRLRRGSASANPPSPNSAASKRSNEPGNTNLVSEEQKQGIDETKDTQIQESSTTIETEKGSGKVVTEKFFIVKSLTLEDLERSATSGIWATQSHNEDTLNQAFKTAENVYLIFSANKSGEYFGYARMEQPISTEIEAEDTSLHVQPTDPPPNTQQPRSSIPSADVPLTIPTPATATAPKGHIIDDSARGTIFWEADTEDMATLLDTTGAAESEEISGDEASKEYAADAAVSAQQSSFGKPFKITWLSTESLPFYRTRGLRNPWNANREVKIARDGTELEPSVGRRLIGMFNQQAQLNAAARGLNQQPSQYGIAQQHQNPHMPYGAGPPGYGYQPQGHANPYSRPY